MINPCFDPRTRTDCPDRKPGCHVHCEKWAVYLKKREQEYELRKKYATEKEVLHEEMKRMKKRRSK